MKWLALSLLLSLLGCARQSRSSLPAQPSIWDIQVKNAARVGDGDSTLRELRNFVLEHPKDLAARRRLAARFLAAGHRDLAIEHFRIAAEQTPSDEALVLELAQLLSAEGLSGEADRLLTNFRQNYAASSLLLSFAAIAKDELGDYVTGEELHRSALARSPQNMRLRNNLAFNLASQQRAAEAEAIYLDLLRSHPSFEAARNNLATLYAAQLNRPAEALLHWKAASGPANAHNNLAAVYLDLGRNEEARSELEKALALRFQFPEAQRNLQILAARTGGTIQLDLKRDKSPGGLTKLARALRHILVAEKPDAGLQAKR